MTVGEGFNTASQRVVESRRVTVQFTSDSGRPYLYDDKTGCIFPWTELREVVLNAYLRGTLAQEGATIEQKYGVAQTQEALRFVRKWSDHYGAFSRARIHPFPLPSATEAVEGARRLCTQLILIVTENCNLRCRYCAYSGIYKYNRLRSPRRMASDLAIHAIDWFVRFVRPQLGNNPRKRFGLGFYGGEPLLNAAAVKAALEHADKAYPALFEPTLTTNGTLLTDNNAALLAEHHTHVLVSIDGPPNEHDRERVDRFGHGTYARILDNLNNVRQRYPTFWGECLKAITVYSYKSDLRSISTFFEQNMDRIPRSGRSSPVNPVDCAYWPDPTSAQYTRYTDRIKELRDEYKKGAIQNLSVPDFIYNTIGFPINRMFLRSRLGDPRVPVFPFTGACYPGYKIAVGVDGTVNVCERVNGTFPVGMLGNDGCPGIDGERIRRLIQDYQRKVLSKCMDCNVTRLCDSCFANALANGRVSRESSRCGVTVAAAQRDLTDYVSIMEANREAQLRAGSMGTRDTELLFGRL